MEHFHALSGGGKVQNIISNSQAAAAAAAKFRRLSNQLLTRMSQKRNPHKFRQSSIGQTHCVTNNMDCLYACCLKTMSPTATEQFCLQPVACWLKFMLLLFDRC